MNAHRLVALLLICLQAAALGYTSQTLLFPLCAAAAAAYGMTRSRRFTISRDQHSVLTLGVFIVFVVKYLVAPHEFPFSVRFIRTEAAHAAAQGLIVLQVLQFYLATETGRLPRILPVLGVAAMVCAGDVQVNQEQRAVFQLFSVGYCALAALYFGSCRQSFRGVPRGRPAGRAIVSGLVLLLVAFAGWVSASLLYRYERHLEGLLVSLMEGAGPADTVGFSGSSQLGSVAQNKGKGANQIALQVVSADTPGYLRGRVFDTLEGPRWYTAASQRPVRPLPQSDESHLREREFAIVPDAAGESYSMQVWLENTPPGSTFTPRGTVRFIAPAERIFVDEYGAIEAPDMQAMEPYTIRVIQPSAVRILRGGPAPVEGPISQAERARLLALPKDLDARIRQLPATVFKNCVSATDKINAVEDYFHQNYTYNLGIQVPAHVAPLTFFLLDKPAGHCEYFASGAAVLLRLAGIPCRYVTGFVVTEQNAFSGLWVARNQHAHAWVEAYDEARGWVTVEATPASGVPAPVAVSQPVQFWEFLRAGLQRFRILLRAGGLAWLASAGLGLIASKPGAAAVLCLAAWWAWSRWQTIRRRVPAVSPELAALHGLLDRMDARLRKMQLERRPGETLHQFAARIASSPAADELQRRAADWYVLYASLRYGADVGKDGWKEKREVLSQSMPL